MRTFLEYSSIKGGASSTVDEDDNLFDINDDSVIDEVQKTNNEGKILSSPPSTKKTINVNRSNNFLHNFRNNSCYFPYFTADIISIIFSFSISLWFIKDT